MSQILLGNRLHTRAPTRLLIVASGHVGNNIFCTPAIQLLHRALPGTRLDVAALNAMSAEVFAGNKAISSVFAVRWRWQMARLAARYDEVVCLHPKSASLLTSVSVPVSIMPPLHANQHHAEQILAFAASLVARTVGENDRGYHLAKIISGRVAASGYPRIGIHLGCGRTAIHGWNFFLQQARSPSQAMADRVLREVGGGASTAFPGRGIRYHGYAQ